MKILEVFENKLRYKNYSPNTIKVYKQTLSQSLKEIGYKDPYRLSTKDIIEFLESKNFSSIAQQNQFIGCLKLFARHILNKKDVHLNKIERPKQDKKLPRVIDKEHLVSCISKIENLKHKLVIMLAFSTGMRVSEVCNLKIEDIDTDRMLIHIKNAKGRKDRIVKLSETVLSTLRLYVKEYSPKVYVLNGQNNLKYSHRSCNQIVKKYIGSDCHFHLLRHSSFTALLESGVDVRVIQKLAGHKSIKTTEVYTHVSNQIISKINLPI